MADILASSKPDFNESNIVDSSKPGFVSSYDKSKGKDSTDESAEPKKETIASGKRIVEDTIKEELKKKPTKEEEKEALKIVKNLVKHGTSQLRASDFKFGNMLFIRYDAKFKENVYDKTPLIFTLNTSKSYVLGLNLHWTPIPLRVTLVKIILKLNKANIKNNRPLEINYKMVKPLILQLGLGPVIRLYIKKRISRRGVIIPPDQWVIASKLNIANFSNGKSPEKLYKQAVKAYKNYKVNRLKRK